MDYEFKTTFWSDFSIADAFGTSAIKDTFDRAFREWKSNYIYLTELVLVLNWKIWEHYEKGNEAVSRLYDGLWSKAQDYAYKHLKGKELDYFWSTTD